MSLPTSDRILTFLLIGSLLTPALCIDSGSLVRNAKTAINKAENQEHVALSIDDMASLDVGVHHEAKKKAGVGGHLHLTEDSGKASSKPDGQQDSGKIMRTDKSTNSRSARSDTTEKDKQHVALSISSLASMVDVVDYDAKTEANIAEHLPSADDAGKVENTQGGVRSWTLVFRQTYPYMFAKGEWSKNSGDDSSNDYAILNKLDEYKVDGKFEFKLKWPAYQGYGGIADQIWTQTSNPVTKTGGGVDGYNAISCPHSANGWGGLEYGGTYSLLDGTVSHTNWYYAIGTFAQWGHGYPGPSDTIRKVELWVKGPAVYSCSCPNGTPESPCTKDGVQCSGCDSGYSYENDRCEKNPTPAPTPDPTPEPTPEPTTEPTPEPTPEPAPPEAKDGATRSSLFMPVALFVIFLLTPK